MKSLLPDEALHDYFEALLETDEAASPTRYADPLEEQRERLQKLLSSVAPQESLPTEAPPVTVAELAPVVPSEPVSQAPLPIPDAVPEIVEEPLTAEAFSYQAEDLEWLPNGRPAWAQKNFEVLLFDVAGLTLAVPLIALGQIQPITDALTPLFGQADWFMGIQPTPGGKIRTVNTAKFVMPERYDDAFLSSARYVISIAGVPWGLAVDSVKQPVTLAPDDVKWRGERSKRPWLAGMVKERMCALLDVPRIGQMLMAAEQDQRT